MTTDANPPDRSPAVPSGAAGAAPRGAITSGAAGAAPRARVRKPAPGWVFGGALATFFAALSLLAVQVRAGEDPALGEAKPIAAVDERPRKVIVKRKVIKRIVIHHPRPAAVAAPSSGGT